MNSTDFQRPRRRPRRQETTEQHLYVMGQKVRFIGGYSTAAPGAADIFRITATLPASGGVLQYRIRNDEERHERVTGQDNLEPLAETAEGEGAALLEKTFGASAERTAAAPSDLEAAGATAAATDQTG